jgi:thiol:disulfide interchange protein DsbD
MATFATGLSSPFFFLALFPAYLQRLPKSGGWLPRVKVVMGFVILAAMFKYLSNIDAVLQTGFLTRDRFLAIWVVLLAMPGFYLLGLLRMDGIKAEDLVGVARALAGAAFLVFALSLLPGMHCGRLGELDAYVPACPEEISSKWIKNDYKGALAKAKAEGKKVFINFTGYACTNCHWMKANMFTRPEIAAALKEYVLVDLYTDGDDAASEANQKLQESRFQTVAIPFYAVFDPDGNVVAKFDRMTKDAQEYLNFLKSGFKA